VANLIKLNIFPSLDAKTSQEVEIDVDSVYAIGPLKFQDGVYFLPINRKDDPAEKLICVPKSYFNQISGKEESLFPTDKDGHILKGQSPVVIRLGNYVNSLGFNVIPFPLRSNLFVFKDIFVAPDKIRDIVPHFGGLINQETKKAEESGSDFIFDGDFYFEGQKTSQIKTGMNKRAVLYKINYVKSHRPKKVPVPAAAAQSSVGLT